MGKRPSKQPAARLPPLNASERGQLMHATGISPRTIDRWRNGERVSFSMRFALEKAAKRLRIIVPPRPEKEQAQP